MSKHKASGASRLRNIGRAGAVVAGGALALSALAGTASAAEGYGDSGYGDSGSGSGTSTTPSTPSTPKSTSLTPTTPVDGFVYHWGKYHYGEENFAGDEVKRITTDPGKYVDIHLDMVKMMLGQTPEGDMGMGNSGY
jgi:hypothetical protein